MKVYYLDSKGWGLYIAYDWDSDGPELIIDDKDGFGGDYSLDNLRYIYATSEEDLRRKIKCIADGMEDVDVDPKKVFELIFNNIPIKTKDIEDVPCIVVNIEFEGDEGYETRVPYKWYDSILEAHISDLYKEIWIMNVDHTITQLV